MDWLFYTLAVAVAYVSGSIPFGYVAVRLLFGFDIRERGSGNIGATNVLRVCGPGIGLPVFALDVAKGVGPVLGAWWLVNARELSPILPVACAAAAIVGHMFSIFLGGGGGKGVATAAGALGALAWQAVLVGFGTWVLLLALTRWVSVASIGAAIVVGGGAWVFSTDPTGADLVRNLFFTCIASLVIWKHRKNVQRLLRGEEPKVGSRRKPESEAASPEAEEGHAG